MSEKKPAPIEIETAREIFCESVLLALGKQNNWGDKIQKVSLKKNKDKKIISITVIYNKSKQKLFWDGKKIQVHKKNNIKPSQIIEKQHESFKIFGIDDNDQAYFCDRNDRLVTMLLHQISRGHLLRLAPIEWWRQEFGKGNQVYWDDAIDFLIEKTGKKDFDPDNIRGRGAWKGLNGDFCYHDGKETIGEIDTTKWYVRLGKRDIGLSSDLATKDIREQILSVARQMTFQSSSDLVRLMGWIALSPFAGALPWRPAILLTGESGSGKSTIIENIVKPIASPRTFSGGETTEPGVRQKIRWDAASIVIDEAETDTDKKAKRRNDLFSLMRQSTSNDTPLASKGTKDGRGMSFRMRSMFLFASIDPEIEHIADDNRFHRVNLILPNENHKWYPLKKQIDYIITQKNCEAVRAYVWENLSKIIETAKEKTAYIQDCTKWNHRKALAEALLIVTYLLIWEDKEIINNELKLITTLMVAHDNISRPNEAEELIDTLLDERIFIDYMKEHMTIRESLIAIDIGCLYSVTKFEGNRDLLPQEINKLAKICERYGLKVLDNSNVAIDINNKNIMHILKRGKGYHHVLWRSKNIVEKNKAFWLTGKTRRCVVLKNVLELPKTESDSRTY
jgi:hypothetical protein